MGGGIYMNAGTSYGSFQDVVTKIFMVNSKDQEEELAVNPSHFSYRKQTFCNESIITGALLRLTPGNPKEISEKIKWMISDRKAKQPLQYPNCGSTFKNPPGHSAGKLIELAGLKGYRCGEAMISDKHANFIINLGGAKAQDILTLIETAECKVKEVHGIQLEREVVIVKYQA